MLVAQVNLAVGAEYRHAIEQAVANGQRQLISQGFNGYCSYLNPPVNHQDIETVMTLIEQLALNNYRDLFN